ncbi:MULTISPECIES: hypothetical protein [unclassified Microcoleus]|uniref:hypothetical protein n=1 Tax=unclassified Microcoleus TaxID=2642155 RepID=UPI002FD4FB96
MASGTILTRLPKTSINLSCCSDRSLLKNAIALFPSASLCGGKKSDRPYSPPAIIFTI